jgi:hypothetical protein
MGKFVMTARVADVEAEEVLKSPSSRAKKQTRDLLNAQALHLDTIQVSTLAMGLSLSR